MRKIIQKFLAGIIITCFIASTVFAIEFSDLSTKHWAYENIMSLVNRDIVNGYENGTYKPEKSVTRGEFFKLVMTTLYGGNEYFEKNNFNFGHWATTYVIEAANRGYIMDGTTFTNLNDAITREEMVHILAKLCIDNDIYSNNPVYTIKFNDISSLSETTKVYIDFVSQNGLINGYTDGTFKASKTMTRAEVATVINRLLNLIG